MENAAADSLQTSASPLLLMTSTDFYFLEFFTVFTQLHHFQSLKQSCSHLQLSPLLDYLQISFDAFFFFFLNNGLSLAQ